MSLIYSNMETIIYYIILVVAAFGFVESFSDIIAYKVVRKIKETKED